MKRFIVFALLGAATATMYGQTAAYEDADGNTSIFLANAKANLIFNVSDSKFSVGYLYEPSAVRQDSIQVMLTRIQHSKDNQAIAQGALDAAKASGNQAEITKQQNLVAFFRNEQANIQRDIDQKSGSHKCGNCEFGISFSGKPSSDLTKQIFQSGNSAASIGGGGSVGIHGIRAKDIFDQTPTDHLRDDWGVINFTYTKSTFNTVADSSATPVAQHFDGFSVMPLYNALLNIPAFNFLLGMSAGVNRTNNLDDLKKVTVATTVAQSGSTSVLQEKDAYLGAYSTSIGVPVYSDFVFVSKRLNWLGIDAFERSNVAKDNRYAEGGFGIFVAKPSNPTAVLGGISVGWKDGDRTIALVGGWSF